MKFNIAVPLLAAVWVCVPAQAAAPADDVRRFIRYPAYDIVSLSPEGKYVAVAHRGDGDEFLSVLRLPDLQPVSATRFSKDLGVDGIIWATEERLLIQPARRHPTRDDYKLPTGEIAAMNADGSHRDMLYGIRAGVGQMGVKARRRDSEAAWARVIDRLPDDPDHVIIQTMGYQRKGSRNEALLLDIHDGVTRRIARSPVRNGNFVVDPGGQVNLVAGSNEAGDLEIYARKNGQAFELVRQTRLNGGMFYPVLPTGTPGEYLFADSASQPTLGLIAWNPVTDARREIFRHPQVDFERLYIAPFPQVWAIRYVDHFPYYHFPDPAHPFVALHGALRTMFPGDDVAIIDQTRDLGMALAYAAGPGNPGTFLLVDAGRRALLQELRARPWLDGAALAAVEPLEVTVRDGLTVRSYLTLPRAAGPHPLIVLVHGGPHGIYDTWGFDPEAQLFASQGYAVLQVNFRGSGGRGQQFVAAGHGKWGAEMQDDVTDTVRYVISEGLVDPKRICIYGASYGGYAALVGAYRDPDLYRCAVGYAGIYDLPLMHDTGDVPELDAGANFLESVLGTDPEDLKARSPVYQAGRIKARVMLVHGKLDERAPFVHARRMRDALKKAGNDPVWLVENREGHGFRGESNRLALYEAMLAFFRDNLGR
ncbi:MAG TPA: prolyl oligopeptidase family serine peptidase [Pseudomonadales bacterium]